MERVQEPQQTANVMPFSRLAASLTQVWVVLFYTLSSLVMTYPLVLHMRDAVVGRIGDNIYFVFLMRWYQRAWFELGISPFFHPWLNYPQGWNLFSTDTSLATLLFGLPASLLAGPTFGYNLAVLITFVFSGWAMFYWVRRMTGSVGAGLVAGFIYAFLPYRMAHFVAGHINLLGMQWFPLYFMGLYEILRGRPVNNAAGQSNGIFASIPWKPMVLTALMLAMIGFTTLYYLYFTLIISAVFVAGFVLLVNRRALSDLHFWARLVVLALLALPPVLLSVLPSLGLESQGGLASRSISLASMYSASPTDFLLPSTDHFLFGRWVGQNFDRSLWIEATLYMGVVALVLAGIAWLHRAETRQSGLLKLALLLIVVAIILAMGTDLHWNSQRVEVPVPEFMHALLDRATVPVPLPTVLLFKYLPFFDKMRALMRIGVFALVFLSFTAGLGVDWLLRRAGPRRALPLTVLLLALVFLDFYPGPYTELATVAARPVDSWLAQQPGQGAVAQFPFIQAEDQDQVYNTLVHGKPYIGGFFSANQPEQYLRIRPVLEQFPQVNGAEGAALLRQLGVQWALFDTRQYPALGELRAQLEALGFRYVTTLANEAVFELSTAP